MRREGGRVGLIAFIANSVRILEKDVESKALHFQTFSFVLHIQDSVREIYTDLGKKQITIYTVFKLSEFIIS